MTALRRGTMLRINFANAIIPPPTFCVEVIGYYKKGTNKLDHRGRYSIDSAKMTCNSLMQQKDISLIVIKNTGNGHTFVWDPSGDGKWKEKLKPDYMRQAVHTLELKMK